MKVFGVSAYDVHMVIRDVSQARYEGNLIPKSCQDRSNASGPRALFTLRVVDSHSGKRGAIGSPGRKGTGPRGMKRSISACWHAHWDVIEEMLRRYPGARVVSGFQLSGVSVQYTAETFRETALTTARVNVGSRDAPVTMPQCCDCDHTLYSDIPPEVDPLLYPHAAGSEMGREYENTTYSAGDTGAYVYGGVDCAGGGTGAYPWDQIPPARPWVKPGSLGVDDTLALIDSVTGDTEAG
jgi:hypothetical protein